ncbi:MAG: N-6 DNA methylase, partial [Bacteroidia bacterium]|nr:N-6 DNA methylase [Bacteroidia bacterium]
MEQNIELNRFFQNFDNFLKEWENFFTTKDYFSLQKNELNIHNWQNVNLQSQVKSALQLGDFEFISSKINLPVFIVQLKDNTQINERIGKKYQFDIAKQVLKYNHLISDQGLFIFVNNPENGFRVSLIYSEYYGTRRKLNYYKRFTFFVSPHTSNKTFLTQFGKCNFQNLDEVKKAFALEPVTKEFYELLENWYYWALKHVQFPQDAEKEPNGRNSQIIRFITRLMFIWFMKAKGIVPETIFKENEVKKILKDELDPNSSSYYLAILQNLFFATLNTPPNKRKFRREYIKNGKNPDFMNHHVFRHHQLVKDPDVFSCLFKNIPFLNGGLFDCLDAYIKADDDDRGIIIRIDGFSDKKENQPKFPNFLMFNNNDKQPGIINILNTFNFTVDENSSIDSDVALDPELLGNVFENLLASYNPETAQTARKATGSFYTPREVVDFMCDQSLFYYLKEQCPNVPEDKLYEIISFAENVPELNEEEKKQIVQSLLNCKIIDPACGSGAFLVGMLHKMTWVLQKLDPNNDIFKNIKLQPFEELKKNFIQPNAELITLLEELKQKLEEKADDYNRKLHLIENCLYGVDIQPIAIQIAKLRFFISLLVDEEPHHIHPLPNLDMKLVIADALINFGPIQFMGNDYEKELHTLMHKYFEATLPQDKEKIKKDFFELKKRILESGYLNEQQKNWFSEFDPFNTEKSNTWFHPALMFGIKDGLDIVIGNPPYIQLQKDGGKLAKKYENQKYQTFARTGDIYALFYERGIQLLKDKGILCYITSNKWMRAAYGEKLRQFFILYQPLLLIDLGPDVFENATVDTNILILQKHRLSSQLFSLKALTLQKQESGINIHDQLESQSVILEQLSEQSWFIGSSAEQRLKEKIESIGKPLKEWDVKIYRGVLTGLNEAFIITTEKRNEILANCKDEEERKRTEAIIKPILRGRDIKRYYYEWAGLW